MQIIDDENAAMDCEAAIVKEWRSKLELAATALHCCPKVSSELPALMTYSLLTLKIER